MPVSMLPSHFTVEAPLTITYKARDVSLRWYLSYNVIIVILTLDVLILIILSFTGLLLFMKLLFLSVNFRYCLEDSQNTA